MLFLALIFCLASSTFAQTPGLGRCPSVNILSTFDPSEYSGVWYEAQRSIPNVHEINVKCLTANISQLDNNTMKVVIRRVSSLTEEQSISIGSGIIDNKNCKNDTNCGKVLFQFPIGIAGHNRYPFSILDTDYTSYSVLWSCTNYIFSHMKYVWVMTRESNPSNTILEEASDVLLKNQIDNIYLKDTNQQHCP